MLCCLDLWGSFEATHVFEVRHSHAFAECEPSQRLAEKWFTVIFGDISTHIEAFKQKLKLRSAELVPEDEHMGRISNSASQAKGMLDFNPKFT